MWPGLEFSSDGGWILVRSRPTSITKHEPVQFLNHFDVHIKAQDFELGVDEFIQNVLDRFSSHGTRHEQLELLWSEVTAERQDPHATV